MRSSDHGAGMHFRGATRFYRRESGWFYATREGEHGPFTSKDDAEADARRYAGLHSHLEQTRAKSRSESSR